MRVVPSGGDRPLAWHSRRYRVGRFLTNADRLKNVEELCAAMAPVLATKPVRAWLQRFDEAGVPAGEVKTIDDVYATPQVRQQNLVWTATHSSLGPIELSGSPLRYGRSDVALRRPPPTLGEHTAEVREEMRSEDRTNGE